MAISIELDSKLPGVRGQHAQGTGYVPSVANGVGAALGETFGKLPEVALNANFHTKVEAINKLDLDNQMAEAELAFDRWNAKAMWGSDGEAPTTLETFDGEADATLRAMRLNGLMNLKGMEAGNAAGMYGKASETAMGDILGALSPQARLAVRDRLLAKRNATLTRMEHHGFTQREAAVRARNDALMDARARLNAEETANAVSRAEADLSDEGIGKAEEAYETSMASLMPKNAWEALRHEEGETYEDYKADYESKAMTNRDARIAAVLAKRDLSVAQIGGDYAVKMEALLAQKRKSILDSMGIAEKDLVENKEWAAAVDGQLAAYAGKAGADFLGSMIDAGNLTFAEAALKDDTRLISDYGISDSRVRTALRDKLGYAKAEALQATNQRNEFADLEAAQVSQLKDDNINYAYDLSIFEAKYNAYVAAGDYKSATKLRKAIDMRRKAEAGAAELAAKREAEKNAKALPPGERTPEEWRAELNRVIADTELKYYDYNLGGGRSVFISKAAYVKDIIWNELGLKSESEKQAMFDSYNLQNGSNNRAAKACSSVYAGIGNNALFWQATKPVGNSYEKGEATGDIYAVEPVSKNPANASLFVRDEKGRVRMNEDSVIGGHLYVGQMENGVFRGERLTRQASATLFDTHQEVVAAWVEANPAATDGEILGKASEVWLSLTVGTRNDFSIEGSTLYGRQASAMAAADALLQKAAIEQSEYLRGKPDTLRMKSLTPVKEKKEK